MAITLQNSFAASIRSRDFSVLVDDTGARIVDLERSSQNSSLLTLHVDVIPPHIYKNGLSVGQLFTVSGASLMFTFSWREACYYPAFCKTFGLVVNTRHIENLPSLTWACESSVCYAAEQIALPEILSPAELHSSTQGNFSSLIVKNLVSLEPSIFVGNAPVVLDMSDWSKFKKLSFTIPELKNPPCTACGRLCQCKAVLDLYDSSPDATDSIRKTSVLINYVSPVIGPPLLIASSHGCAVQSCATETIMVSRSVDIKVILSNFPKIAEPFTKCLMAGPRCVGDGGYISPVRVLISKGSLKSISILSSTALETKILVSYTAPPLPPDGRLIDMFFSYGLLPRAHLYLSVGIALPPSVSVYFPTTLTLRAASTRSITIKISNWVAGEMVPLGASAACQSMGSVAQNITDVVVINEAFGSAELSLLLGTLESLVSCQYLLTLHISQGSHLWSLSVSVDLVATGVITSISPSFGSVLGGQVVKLVLTDFPIVNVSSDVNVACSNLIDLGSRGAADVSVVWSSESSTCLTFSMPSTRRPGVETIQVTHGSGASAKESYMFMPVPIVVSSMIPAHGGIVELTLFTFPAEMMFDIEVSMMREGLRTQLPVQTSNVNGNQFILKCIAPSVSKTEILAGQVIFVNKMTSKMDHIWRFQPFDLHYFSVPVATIIPSRASRTGGSVVLLYVRGLFFQTSELQEYPLVLFGKSAARVLQMSKEELRVEVPPFLMERTIQVTVIFASKMSDKVPDEAATAITQFNYFNPIPKVASVSPSRWEIQGHLSVRVALLYFPKIEPSSGLDGLTVAVGNVEATVVEVVYSGTVETILTINVPAIDVEQRSGYVQWAGVTAIFAFDVFDKRATLFCRREDALGCVGTVLGGDILVMTVNFGPIISLQQLSAQFAGVDGAIVHLVHSNSSSTTIKLLVPKVGEQILSTNVDLIVSNDAVDASEPRRAASMFRYAAAPSLVSATVQRDGAGMQLVFDAETNGLQNEYLQCSDFFDDSTTAIFGTNPRCFWENTRTLTVQFGLPGLKSFYKDSVIMVRPGVIFESLGLTALRIDTKRKATLELHPLMNVALHVTGHTSVGPCDTAIILARATFWGQLIFSWSSPSCENEEDITLRSFCAELASLTSHTLHLSPGLLKRAGKYNLRVSASSPLGVSSTHANFVLIKSQFPVPLVSLSGRETYSISDEVIITASAGIPSVNSDSAWSGAACTGESLKKYNYEWIQVDLGTETDGLIPQSSLSKETASLFLKGTDARLLPGEYLVSLEISSGTQSASISAQFFFKILKSSLVARIEGNADRQISHNVDVLQLNAALSHDPDAIGSTTSATLHYAWSCRDDFGFVCKHKDTLDHLEFASTHLLTIPTDSFEIHRRYFFDLKVSKDSRISKTGPVQVYIVSEHVPLISINCPGAKFSNGACGMNPGQRLILQATCDQCTGLLWSRNGVLIHGAAKGLSVYGSDLSPGKSYKYSVKVFATAPSGQTCSGMGGLCEGFASINITVNRPPHGGYCTMSLPSLLPTEMDVFPVECFGFCDENQPLRYTYGFTLGESDVYTGTSMMRQAFMYLPAAESVSVFAIIHDSFGASSRFEVGSYAVQPSDIGALSMIAKMQSLVMLGRSEFHNFALVLGSKLERQAQERRSQRRDAPWSTRASIEEDAMIRTEALFALSNIFSSEPPTIDNALQTIASLTALVANSDVSGDAALVGASILLDTTDILETGLPALSGRNTNKQDAHRIITCTARLRSNILLSMPGSSSETVIERQLRPALDVAAALMMLDAAVGERVMLCSSATNTDCNAHLSQTRGAIISYSTMIYSADLSNLKFSGGPGMMTITIPAKVLVDTHILAVSVAAGGTVVVHNQIWQHAAWGVIPNVLGAR